MSDYVEDTSLSFLSEDSVLHDANHHSTSQSKGTGKRPAAPDGGQRMLRSRTASPVAPRTQPFRQARALPAGPSASAPGTTFGGHARHATMVVASEANVTVQARSPDRQRHSDVKIADAAEAIVQDLKQRVIKSREQISKLDSAKDLQATEIKGLKIQIRAKDDALKTITEERDALRVQVEEQGIALKAVEEKLKADQEAFGKIVHIGQQRL
ncbi:hypothetical protein OC842_007690 [Tilletia horrida]|uniref:Uncharacterized protein n=1 Tax=Tilletia horrida TaxID=155126 RepID=A0AAN6G3D8_9BASI|nr:hypothetical protein OC842_007690 [Tilletia horrida]